MLHVKGESVKMRAYRIVILCYVSVISSLVIAQPEQYKTLTLNERQVCDVELLLNGGFEPLQGFMGQRDYNSVVEHMRLADNTVWPIPIVLDIKSELAASLQVGSLLKLYDRDTTALAILTVSDIWKPNKQKEAELVYGTTNTEHPGVKYLLQQTQEYYIGGTLKALELPAHYDFTQLRKTPAELKAYFKQQGYDKIVAFQTRNPMHRAHVELTRRAGRELGAHILIHPAVGPTKPDDIDYFTRVRGYKKLLSYYPENAVTLSLLPLAMHMAGPREALLHAIIRKNYGCTHFVVGRDHAGPGKDSTGKDFYGPYQAQELVAQYAQEIGITPVFFKEMLYLPDEDVYKPADQIEPGVKVWSLSGTQLRNLLRTGGEIPSWFSYPEIVRELHKSYPSRAKQGLTIFLTGLSGSGKSTLANALALALRELQYKSISLLDGDELRAHLTSELGFSKEHRSLNVRRTGFVAREITKSKGIAICSLIAPYQQDRAYNRTMIESVGNYIEVFISTPLQICEERDVKGLYAKARAGIIPQFTGINDPYEQPVNPELTIDTSKLTIQEALDSILSYLKQEQYIL